MRTEFDDGRALPGRQRVTQAGIARVDLGERNERERPLVQPSMRDHEIGLVEAQVGVGEDIEIEHARAPAVRRDAAFFRLASSGNAKGIKPRREDGVVRPLLPLWREETEAYCRDRDLAYRLDSSNPHTARGLIRYEILPLLERLHPAARDNVLRALDRRRTVTPALAELLDSPVASRRVDLGGGVQAVREHDRLWLEASPVDLEGEVRWGRWRIEAELPGLKVRGWRHGDRLAGRSKKIQDVFVDAKIPRSDREGWPLVVRGDEVVAVPGIVECEGVSAVHDER